MKKLFIAVSIGLGAVLIYAGSFPYILARQAEAIAQGVPYCIVEPIAGPDAFSGWTVPANERMKKINGFQEVSLVQVLARRSRGNTADFRHTLLIHLGIVVQGKAYHWSFKTHEFMENNTYVDFRKEFNRAAAIPDECTIP